MEQNSLNCLVLDFDLYPAADVIRELLATSADAQVAWYRAKDIGAMQDADWEALLAQLQRARRCITL